MGTDLDETAPRPRVAGASEGETLDVSEVAHTRTGETSGGFTLPSLPEEPPFPVEGWDRYRVLGHLGTGGMGSVFKAFDPTLDRPVALKFLHGDRPEQLRRFQREARAQARVEHERIGKVYEVGEVEGRPYIAMQFIDGVTLREAAPRMSVEEKVLVVARVAEGLHEAHRKGLLHRDIKPSNIMVERDEAGEWKPYLMDFGIAQDPDSAGMTVTGMVMGTPYYMSPEQARGEVRRLDRRSDVYSLGATLYEVLTGRRVFEAIHPTEVLRSVLEEVPAPLRERGSEIPLDVEAITMRCLRKRPENRYESARALAEDLRRYLDGDPVRARRTTFLYRLRKKAAKHRVAVTVAAASALLIAGAVGWGGYTRWSAARQVRLAQSFGRQVERIESLARFAYTMPLHDVRPQREELRAHIARIEARARELGRVAQGPGSYAVGRGHLALGEIDEARIHLERAWEGGYREPEVAYALGIVLGETYRREVREADQIGNDSLRAARRQELATLYREPALEFLRRSEGVDLESPDYGAALLAFYDERYEDALARARAAYESVPWLYEAHRLEGDVHLARAKEMTHRGEQEAAEREYDSAEEAYRAAVAVGESDPVLHAALCELEKSRMRAEINGRGQAVRTLFESGLAACERALTADPGHAEALVLLAALYGRLGEWEREVGEDPTESLERAVEAGQRAVEARPEDAVAHGYLGAAWREVAVTRLGRGEDASEALERALDAYDRAVELDPRNFSHANDRGLAYKNRALQERNRGEDPTESLNRAIESYERSLEVNPEQVAANINLGVAYYHRAGYELSVERDPSESLQRAAAACRRGLEIDPDQMVAHYQLGRIYTDLASWERRQGEDPRRTLHRAADSYRRAMESNPDSPYVAQFLTGRGVALQALALDAIERGEDPGPDFEGALEAFRRSAERNPAYLFAHNGTCAVLRQRASHSLDRGESPSADLEAAVEACGRALAINPSFPEASENLRWVLGMQERLAQEGGEVADIARGDET